MSNGYRNGAFAVGLIAGVGLALNLTLWLDYQAKHKADSGPQTDSQRDSSEIGQFWDWLIGTFVSPSDTLAQWIMAVFTIAVVFLVWKTLVATQDMAIDQRRIGMAQSCAYICFPSAQIGFDASRKKYAVSVEIKNTGNSPAQECRSCIMSANVANIEIREQEPVFEVFMPHADIGTQQSIFVSSSIPDDKIEGILTGNESTGSFEVVGRLSYRDVFNRDRWTTFSFHVPHGTKPDGREMHITRDGNKSDKQET